MSARRINRPEINFPVNIREGEETKMSILQFRRQNVVQEITACLQDETDEVTEALVIGKKKSGEHFSYVTHIENIAELIGYLEAVKTELALEMISQADRAEE